MSVGNVTVREIQNGWILSKTNGDTSLISELRSAYENEKSIKKASLLSNYTD